MYALARNSWKYLDRDKRSDKTQLLEFDFLAPDTISEMANALDLFATLAGKAHIQKLKKGNARSEKDYLALGKKLLETGDAKLNDLSFFAEGFEHSTRPVRIIKMIEAYRVFKELINYFAAEQLLQFMDRKGFRSLTDLQKKIPALKSPAEWLNVGGQLIKSSSIKKLISDINKNKVRNWNEVHAFYTSEGDKYVDEKLIHALSFYKRVFGNGTKWKEEELRTIFSHAVSTRQWMNEGIRKSREKDYENPFRQMVYDSEAEMNKVVGSLDDNSFINQENEKFLQFKKRVSGLLKKMRDPVRGR
jgi:hypothetical protein